jgi:diguanylate cyclase (GGDEF)-like protein
MSLGPVMAMRLSYIYPGLLLTWAAALGAAGLQYYGQYTAYIIGVCSIAFLFYQEVVFTAGLYAVCGLLFLSLSLFWGLADSRPEALIGIASNLVVVNVVAVLASRLNFNVRLKLYRNERETYLRNLELKRLNDRLEGLASTDSLTGIANRHQLESYLDTARDKTALNGGRLACTLFDVDHFKKINDTYGHQAGDQVLRGLADLVKRSIRSNDLFGRWGGEEFLILYLDAGLEQAFASAENIRKAIEGHRMANGLAITCSFGVAEHQPDDTGHSFVARADKAMYKAKDAGRNRVMR